MAKKKTDDPADRIFKGGQFNHGTYLFDDGSIGYVADPDFEIDDDYFESAEDYEEYVDKGTIPSYLWQDGKEPIGNIYIDRYDLNGEFYQGGCFWYYDGETLGDWCDRNEFPRPIREVPDEAYEALENEDMDAFAQLAESVPELKKLLKGNKPKKAQPKKTESTRIPVKTLETSEIHPLDEEDFYSYDIKMARCPNCGIEGYSGADQKFDDISDGVIKCKTCGCVFRYRWNNYGIEYDQWDHKVFDEYRAKTEKERKDRFAKSNVYVGGGMAYGPEHFDRYRYGGLFDFENPKDRSKILNFNFKGRKTREGKKR